MSEQNKKSEREQMFSKIVTVAGGVLISMPCAVPWYWGNMSSYALSYIAIVVGETKHLESPIVSSCFVTGWIGLMLFTNVLCRYIARRWLLLTGMLSTVSSCFVAYTTIKISFLAFAVSYGLLQGIGLGLIYSNIVHLIVSVADKDVGLLTALLQASFSLGPIFITLLMTLYTNPNNYAPTYKIGSTLYFTQTDVLEQVPSMYLVLGLFSLTLCALGFILLQFNKATGLKFQKNLENPETRELVVSPRKNQSYSSEFINNKQTLSTEQGISCTAICASRESDSNLCKSSTTKDYTLKEVLTSPTFYLLWLCFFIEDITFVLLTNYYKLYGQIYIHDDYFFATLGTTFLICGGAFRILWGISVDRYGVKNCFIVLTSGITVMSLFFCFTALVSRWLYFSYTVLFVIVAAGFYGSFLAAISKKFGKANVSVNYGLLLTSSVLWNLVSPAVVSYFIENFGWFVTFMTSGILSFTSLILVIFYLPQL